MNKARRLWWVSGYHSVTTASVAWCICCCLRSEALLGDGAPEAHRVFVQHVLEGEEEGGRQHALGDLGADA